MLNLLVQSSKEPLGFHHAGGGAADFVQHGQLLYARLRLIEQASVFHGQGHLGRHGLGQSDFVFSDEDDGVVALKRGDEILYASLYWRARFAVNSLARVHYLTPTIERDATVWEDVEYDDSGMIYTRDGRTIEAQTGRHEKSRGDLQQALEGERMPIAEVQLDYEIFLVPAR